TRRGEALVAAPDNALSLVVEAGEAAAINWQGHRVAVLRAARHGLLPTVARDRALDCLPPPLRDAARERLQTWLEAMMVRHLPGVTALAAI
ncbi:hypothetical protein ACJELQ_26595, partial [Escherichia coli]